MLRFSTVLCGILLLALCTACAPRSGGSPSDKAASDEWRSQNLEARFLEYKEDRQASQAELHDSIERLTKQLAAIEKQLEQTDAKNAALAAEADALREALRAKAQMGAAMAAEPLAESGTGTQPSDTTQKNRQSGQRAADGKSTSSPTDSTLNVASVTVQKKTALKPVSAKASTQSYSRSTAKASEPSTPETRMYENGLKMVRTGNVAEGRNILDAFLGDFPASPLVPNALYWLGETYYHEKRYAQAILTFKDVVRRFPKHNKAAASMLKIGFSYDQLGDRSNARFYLQALVDDYPQSEPARMARTRLLAL